MKRRFDGLLVAFLAVLVLVVAALPGCATGRAESGAANPTTGFSGGVFASSDLRIEKVEIRVDRYPVGMEKWTPEQIAALSKAMGEAGHGLGDLFYSRQQITPTAERGAGDTAASPTNSLNLQLDAANALRAAAGLPPITAEDLKKKLTGE